MIKIDDITNVIISLISLGCILRVIYISFCIIQDPDNKDKYIKQIKTTIIAFVLAISIFSIKELVYLYFE